MEDKEPVGAETSELVHDPLTSDFPGPLTLNRYVSLLVCIAYLTIAFFWDHPVQLAATLNAPEAARQAEGPLLKIPPAKVDQGADAPPSSWSARVLFTGIYCLFPLACIWYPELIANRGGFGGSWFGYAWEPEEAARTRGEPPPRVFMIIVGWIFLVGVPLMMILLSVNVGN